MRMLFPFLALLLMTSFLGVTSLSMYVGKVRLYVDSAGINKWIAATGKSQWSMFLEEMNSTFFEINEIFKSLESNNVKLQLQIERVIQLNKNIFNANRNGEIVNSNALDRFETYISSSYRNDSYDLAVLMTGYNLVKRDYSDNSYGYAYIGTVCSAKALGVVELSSTYHDVLAAAHEIGHILGAEHDGIKTSSNCNSQSGEIMNAETKNASPKHFQFSWCSANSIRNTIEKLTRDGKNCLTTWSSRAHIWGPSFGTLMTPDEICKRSFGPSSYIARKAYKFYGDNVCNQIACMTKTVGNMFYWTFVPTPQGLQCGKNKQCVLGRCVQTSGGSAATPDSCPFGDQPKIEGDFQTTCSRMSYSECSRWNQTCCQTCSDPGTADEVCGRLQDKYSAMARRAYNGVYGDNLCSKLACLSNVEGTIFHWNYYKAPNGMICGKSKRCSNGKCINSHVGDPDIRDSCPFGDQPWLAGTWQTTCADHIKQNGCSGQGWNETCCASCYDPGTADEVCRELVGTNSAMARRAYSNYGNSLCSKLACLTSVQGTRFFWKYFTAPDGMACGKNKRCTNGQCILTKAGDSNMSDWCPYGDQPWLGGNWKTTCSDYVKRFGCAGNGWDETCCSTC